MAGDPAIDPMENPQQRRLRIADAATEKARTMGQSATDGTTADQGAKKSTAEKLQGVADALGSASADGSAAPAEGPPSGYESVPRADEFNPIDLFSVLPDV